jgi:hypothetical protein
MIMRNLLLWSSFSMLVIRLLDIAEVPLLMIVTPLFVLGVLNIIHFWDSKLEQNKDIIKIRKQLEKRNRQ